MKSFSFLCLIYYFTFAFVITSKTVTGSQLLVSKEQTYRLKGITFRYINGRWRKNWNEMMIN
jgi:hypothetical protein